MRGKRKRASSPDPRPNMTPMIDVTFLLLIFFMLTVQFRTLDGLLSANLPRGVGPNPGETEPREEIRVRIDVLREGRADRLVRWTVGPWSTTDAAELSAHLRAVHRTLAERGVVVDARAGTLHGEAVATLDALRLAGWERIGFAAAR